MKATGCFYFMNRSKKESKVSAKTGSAPSYGSASVESRLKSENVSGERSFQLHPSSPSPLFSQRPESLRVFTCAEVKAATNNFNRSLVVGEGGFGCVYRGTIRSSEDPNKKVDVAVKQLSHRGMQGHKEWLTEVHILGKVEHPNLVKLLGFCAEDDERGMQRLLIYEFMPNRSVLDHLSLQSATPLSWQMRLRVALDAARGLTYLHEEMSFQVVGTIGYAAPEYMQTGHLMVKSDVWSYGVVLYELITGRRPIDRNRPKGEHKLLDWIRPYISNYRKFPSIIDPCLGQDYNLKSAQQLAAIANKCLIRNPKTRPNMSEVLTLVAKVVSAAAIDSPPQSLAMGDPTAAEEEGRNKRRG